MKIFTSDVYDFQSGEWKHGKVVQLRLVGATHEQHLLLQT